MEVTILGSGTAVPVPDRLPAGVLVATGDQVIVVDMGPGVLRRVAQAGHSATEITTVLLTHFHTDHTADLAALLFALRNPALATRAPLQLLGHAGLEKLLGHLTAAWPWLEPRGYDLVVREIGPGEFDLDGVRARAVRIDHAPTSLAYRLEDESGASVAISGDAGVCAGLAEVARGVDLFICEAAYPDEAPVHGHLTPSLAAAAAAEAGAARLCLTHFYPECSGHDLEAQARSRFGGEVVLAEDLMRFELPGNKCP